MVKYKSHCRQTKTFHGVTFKYGETKIVPGYIHDPRFVCLGTVKPAIVDPNPEIEHKKSEDISVKKLALKSETKPSQKKSEYKKKEEKKSEKPATTKLENPESDKLSSESKKDK